MAVLLLLAVAVLREWLWPSAHNPAYIPNGHLPGSISDCYWTAVRPVFGGALVALGVGMIVLRPETDVEDLLLNLAGVLAPMVAFVPTPAPEVCGPRPPCHARGLPVRVEDSIGNNAVSLLVAGAITLALYGPLSRLGHAAGSVPVVAGAGGRASGWSPCR